MKINKRRTPELIAGVLFLGIFFAPCAGMHAQELSKEQIDSIQTVVSETIKDSNLATKSDVDNSVRKAVSDAAKQSGSSLSNEKITESVNNAVYEHSKKLASKDDVGSVQTPAWIALGVSALLGLACLGILIFVLVRVIQMPKKKDEAQDKKEKESERDRLFDHSRFKTLEEKTDRIDKAVAAIKPVAASEISNAVKTEFGVVKTEVGNFKPRLEALEKKVGEIKVPAADKIAEEIYGLIGPDTEKTKTFVQKVEEKYKGLDAMISKYGDLIELQKMLNEKQQTNDRQARELDRKLDEIARKKTEFEAKEKSLAEERKKLDAEKKELPEAIRKAEESAVQKCKEQFEPVKKGLESKISGLETNVGALKQEKSSLESKINGLEANVGTLKQEKASLESKNKGLEANVGALKQEKTSLESKISGLEASVGALKQEKSTLETKNAELQKKVDGHDREIQSYTEQLEKAEKEKAALQKANATLITEKQALIKETQDLSLQVEKLSGEVQRIRDEVTAKFEAEIKELRETKERLSKDLESEKNKNKDLEYQIVRLEDEVSKLQKENARLAKALADAEARIAQLETENRKLSQDVQALQEENTHLKQELETARNMIKQLETVMYPAEFMSDPKFAVLKQHLDEWVDIPESAIVRASLQLFSQRNVLKEDTVAVVLRDISFGVSQTLSRKHATPSEIVAELIKWCEFVQGYSNDSFRFNLQIPGLGVNYDSNQMTTSRSIERVQKVLSWMVLIHRKNSNPIKKLAEVE